MLNFANSFLDYEDWYCFISIKFDFWEKVDNLQKFQSQRKKIFVGIILVFLYQAFGTCGKGELVFVKYW